MDAPDQHTVLLPRPVRRDVYYLHCRNGSLLSCHFLSGPIGSPLFPSGIRITQVFSDVNDTGGIIVNVKLIIPECLELSAGMATGRYGTVIDDHGVIFPAFQTGNCNSPGRPSHR